MKTRKWLMAAGTAIALLSHSQAFAADPFAGESRFQDRCAMCHGIDGRGAQPGTPDLRKLMVIRTEQQWINRLRNGKGGCPPFSGILRDEDLANIAAYLQQLKR